MKSIKAVKSLEDSDLLINGIRETIEKDKDKDIIKINQNLMLLFPRKKINRINDKAHVINLDECKLIGFH